MVEYEPNVNVGRVASLYRYPVKGFTPERIASTGLTAGNYFPCDRLYAVENGPYGGPDCTIFRTGSSANNRLAGTSRTG